jgi:RHS repeat-associated protein
VRALLAASFAALVVVTGCGPSVATQISALSGARALYFHHTYAAGPQLTTDASSQLHEDRRSEPFGAAIDALRDGVVQATDYRGDPLNSLNKFADPDTGWSYHGARWLAPDTALWHSPDPPTTAPDPKFMLQPWTLHPYQYVSQNPIAYWDPDGRDKTEVLGIAGGSAFTDILSSVGVAAAQLPAPGIPLAGPIVVALQLADQLGIGRSSGVNSRTPSSQVGSAGTTGEPRDPLAEAVRAMPANAGLRMKFANGELVSIGLFDAKEAARPADDSVLRRGLRRRSSADDPLGQRPSGASTGTGSRLNNRGAMAEDLFRHALAPGITFQSDALNEDPWAGSHAFLTQGFPDGPSESPFE